MLLSYSLCDRRREACSARARIILGSLLLVIIVGLTVSAQTYSEIAREARQQASQTPSGQDGNGHPGSPAINPTAIGKDGQAIPQSPEDKLATPNPSEEDAAKINIFTGMGRTQGNEYRPLTGKQRWQFYLNQTFLPSAYFGVAWSSLVDHLGNQPPEWGHGASGLGKRVASRFGGNVVGGTLLAVGGAITGEDPRYISSRDHGFWRRSRHALAFSVLTYNREGQTRPAFAGLTAQYGSSIITQLWLPKHDHLWRDGFRDGTVQLGFNGMFNLVEEFWPELMHVIKRK